MLTGIKQIKSVTTNVGHYWSVQEEEVVGINLQYDKALKMFLFVVLLANENTVNIPMYSASHWIEYVIE